MSAHLSLNGVRKSFGKTEILRGVTLDVEAGTRHAIIGPNGAGKTTLFAAISGQLAIDAGSIDLAGRSITNLTPDQIARRGLARSFQVSSLFANISLFENLRIACLSQRGYGVNFWRLIDRDAGLTERVNTLLERFELDTRQHETPGQLAYAEQRKLELAMACASDASVILLDEPTAGMSRAETEAMVQLVRQEAHGKTLVIVEHDMGVVFDLADRISVLVYGEIIATGSVEEIRGNAKVQQAYLGTAC